MTGISGIEVSQANPERLFVRAHAGRAREFRLNWVPVLSREAAKRLAQAKMRGRRLIATRSLAEPTRRMAEEVAQNLREKILTQ